MVIVHGYVAVYQRGINLHFPVVFLGFSHFLMGFPMVFLFSSGFPMIILWVSRFPIFPWFSHGFARNSLSNCSRYRQEGDLPLCRVGGAGRIGTSERNSAENIITVSWNL